MVRLYNSKAVSFVLFSAGVWLLCVGDGIADVDQIPPSALLVRKANLFLTSCKDPQQISQAW